MKKYDYIIGVDADTGENGVGVVRMVDRRVYACSLPSAALYVALQEWRSRGSVLVVVEAGWLNRSNWHTSAHDTIRSAAAKGYDVGCNHQRGKDIVEWCEYNDIDVRQQPPLRKVWATADRKISVAELQYIVGRYGNQLPKPCTQDMRDAVLLAWEAANLPTIVSTAITQRLQATREARRKNSKTISTSIKWKK